MQFLLFCKLVVKLALFRIILARNVASFRNIHTKLGNQLDNIRAFYFWRGKISYNAPDVFQILLFNLLNLVQKNFLVLGHQRKIF